MTIRDQMLLQIVQYGTVMIRMKNKTLCFGLLAIMFTTSITSCVTKSRQPKIRAVEVISQSQFVMMENGKIYDRRDTALLCYKDDFVIYREQYFYVKYNDKALQGNTMVISDDPTTIDHKEKCYDYYIWKNEELNGIKYGKDVKTINVDSLYVKKLFKNANFFDVTYDRLLDVRNEGDKRSFKEIYVNIAKPDESYCDTTIYCFSSKLDDIPYSLSKVADSLKGAKLVEVRFIYNGKPKGIASNIDLPRKEMVYKLSKINLKNTADIDSIIEKFKADKNTLKK